MRTLTTFWLLIALAAVAYAAPNVSTVDDASVSGFSLSREYVISNPLLKDKVVVRAGRYTPWFKDGKGIYYGQSESAVLVYIPFSRDAAWTAVINKEFHYKGPLPAGAVEAVTTVLLAELFALREGSITRQMRCRKDFISLIAWDAPAAATGPGRQAGTPGETSSSTLNPLPGDPRR